MSPYSIDGVGATGSRAEYLATQIEKDILDSAGRSGDRLGLRTDLIEQYSVSPAVMNEALQILRERGLIVVKRGASGGIFVNEVPPQLRIGVADMWFQGVADVGEVFQARLAMDTLLCEMAFHRVTPEGVKTMSWALDEIQAVRRDPKAFFIANLRFHLAIARVASIPYLTDLYGALVTILSNSVIKAQFIPDHEGGVSHSIESHGQLLDAIRSDNIERLRIALANHSEQVDRVFHDENSSTPEMLPRLVCGIGSAGETEIRPGRC
ncbi:FadR/GntR family transcriptional regulator [Rhodococcus sp. ACS1]|uniref:FadR/GntR family transcriptional regulator n=1 Tax=Rhodococcus sp. ACS1 TaxID=2028570 RepID=UPI001C527336|nr:FCD domain-containing protein [Rhodococcus sp. ACS1]